MDTETLDGLAYDNELDELDPPEDHPLSGRADVYGIARANVHGCLQLGPAIPMTLNLPTVDALRTLIC